MKEVDPLRAEIDLLRVEIDPPRGEVDPLRPAADRLRVENDRLEVDPLRDRLDPLRAEVDLLRLETDRLSAEVDPLRTATVLIVGVNYAPEKTGFGPRTTAMARDLAGIAERVVVLTGAPTDLRGPFPRIPGRTGRSEDQDRGIQVVRHQHHLPSRSGGLSRARCERSFLRAVLRTPVRNTPDLVIGMLPSVGAAVAAARFARRFRVPLVLVVQDLITTRTRDGGLVASAVARGQAEALRQATRVVLIGSGLRAAVIALGVEKARIDVISDWTAPPDRRPSSSVRTRLGLAEEDLVAVHIGNIGFGQDVPTIVRAARRVVRRHLGRPVRDLRLLLVGEGSRRGELEAVAADLPGVQFLDPVTATEYPALLAAADVLIVTELEGTPDRTLPSRMESYLRAGRPVIAAVNPDGEAERVLRSVPGAVIILSPGDSGALAAVLIRLRDDPRELARLRDSARGYAEAARNGTNSRPDRGLRDVVRAALTSR